MNTGNPPKSDVARKLAAALAYIGFINEDWTGVYSFSNKLGESYAASRKAACGCAVWISSINPGPTARPIFATHSRASRFSRGGRDWP